MLFKTGTIEKQEFINILLEVANDINAKIGTREWIQELLKKLKWK